VGSLDVVRALAVTDTGRLPKCCTNLVQVALSSATGQQRLLESQLNAAETKAALETERLTQQVRGLQHALEGQQDMTLGMEGQLAASEAEAERLHVALQRADQNHQELLRRASQEGGALAQVTGDPRTIETDLHDIPNWEYFPPMCPSNVSLPCVPPM
jgi:hypothetical protein